MRAKKAVGGANKRSKAKPTFVGRLTKPPLFGKLYLLASLLVLLCSSIYWSLLGARIQQSNADQLINRYLLNDSATFRQSTFPDQHSFLLKWPLYLLVKVAGSSDTAFVFITVLTVIVTVGLFALILYRIEQRPLIFGTLCLALASALLLVPAQPVAGALLPVNMAMLTTRNLEYIIYIASIFLFARSHRLRSLGFWLAIVLMATLAASDRLFLFITIGGALIALFIYALSSGWNLVSLSVRWLLGGLIAGVGALLILLALNSLGITHLSAASGAGPYGPAHSLHAVLVGSVFAGIGILSNFGANPAFSSTVLRSMPHEASSHLFGVSGLAFIVNVVILLAGVFTVFKLVSTSLAYNQKQKVRLSAPTLTTIMLIWTSLAALILFVASDHNYSGDARYLTIVLFAVFMSLATYSSSIKKWRPELVLGAGLIIVIGVFLALPTVTRAYRDDQAALQPDNDRNSLVADAINHHPVSVLVGDYWRVIPIKQLTEGTQAVMPLSACFQAKNDLSSQAWQINLQKNSFAYLLSLDRGLANCTLDQTIAHYGRPNSTALISGSLTKPRELLLFYDRGAHKSAPKVTLKTPSTVLPIALDELPYTTCPVPSIMNIVAHEDDDLLFMSPDLTHDIQVGHCVRTIYVTAGDAGGDQFYWLNRQKGSEAAYSKMLGVNDIWIDRIVKLANNEFITVSNPRGNSKISLIFMHLPDGSPKGQGFAATHFESLDKLDTGKIASINSVDNQSTYTSDQLIGALSSLMDVFQTTEIRTQANLISSRYPDHSDHIAVGRYAKKSYQRFESQKYDDKVIIPIAYYVGYPIQAMPENVSGNDLQQKSAAFLTYAQYDGNLCLKTTRCGPSSSYGKYLARQYAAPD